MVVRSDLSSNLQVMPVGPFESLLLLSFGGPNGNDDVIPFLENVTRGRDVPAERLKVVAEQYAMFDGKSPINEQNLGLLEALKEEIARRNYSLPTYWGNRNWHPFLTDTVQKMAADGHRKSVCLVTSAFSSYSGCRQYHQDLENSLEKTGNQIEITRVRVFWNHPEFLGAVAERLIETLSDSNLPQNVRVLFTAHSLPESMSAACDYTEQLNEASELIMDLASLSGEAEVVYQSRSGPPQIPWLEPDINDRLKELAEQQVAEVVVVPLGFVSDHMEVLYDLDTLAATTAQDLGIKLHRAHTVGTHPRFIAMLIDLIEEAAGTRQDRPAMGACGPRPDQCASNCCPPPARRPTARP